MIPVDISKTITTMDDDTLCNHIDFLSYQFCVNADFTKEDAVKDLVRRMEMTIMEGLMRIFQNELGYRPYQNKVYEKSEKIFDEQNAYNINRMLSTLRRAKTVPIDPQNEKYLNWMSNRIRYGSKTIIAYLTEDCVITV